MWLNFSESTKSKCCYIEAQRRLLLPRTLWGLHHSSDQTTLVTIWLGDTDRLVREPVNMTTQPRWAQRLPSLLWQSVSGVVCHFCVSATDFLYCFSSSTEHIFSLRSIPLLLSYITALSQVTIQQRRCKGLQDNCTSCLALQWQRALLRVVVDFSTHLVEATFFHL